MLHSQANCLLDFRFATLWMKRKLESSLQAQAPLKADESHKKPAGKDSPNVKRKKKKKSTKKKKSADPAGHRRILAIEYQTEKHKDVTILRCVSYTACFCSRPEWLWSSASRRDPSRSGERWDQEPSCTEDQIWKKGQQQVS